MAEKLMFFIDFDGTISREDVCATMVKRYARDGWQELNRLWEEGALSTEECAGRTLELMDVEPVELEVFFKSMNIDESFLPFVSWANHQDLPLFILSDGYGNYIKEILSPYKLDIPYYANHLDYDRGWRIKCSYQVEECTKCGVCKTKLIEELLKPGYVSVYIGDGYSDICPAEGCDMVFAKKQLARLCKAKGIPYFDYDSFDDVQRIVETLWEMG
ncbi:MAG: MtnX-like HAD-IB family phosphatase [Ignavibacteriales bacterium]